jgi:FAD/FMN-containing dehydrogenase
MAGDLEKLSLRSGIGSWGRYPQQRHHLHVLWDRSRELPRFPAPALPYGRGRSYGDVCLNDGGVLLSTRGLDRFISLDDERGWLRCEAGLTFEQILGLIVPRGWFLPVTPGTRLATLGGAIANDVHGKNHHRVGSFGHFVRELELLRTDGQRLRCSRQQNAEWFAATIGGLGLTGLITWAELELKRIHNPWLIAQTTRFFDVDEFFALSADSERDYEYTVAWIDCTTRGRGLFMRANHAPPLDNLPPAPRAKRLRVPFTPPLALVNRATLMPFNAAYFWSHRARGAPELTHFDAFFYPLDALLEWNRLYGPRGFLQYQCVVPPGESAAITALLDWIGQRRAGSFLAVLKTFGDRAADGMLSFPRAGITLALDFPIVGPKTFALLTELDRIVLDAKGAIYPAKDARMPPAMFRAGFPASERFTPFIDPGLSSSFRRRVMH